MPIDDNFIKLNTLFPKCGYVQCRKYDPHIWEGKV